MTWLTPQPRPPGGAAEGLALVAALAIAGRQVFGHDPPDELVMSFPYLLIPFTALGRRLGMQPLPETYFAWLAAILLCYAALVQVVKVGYIKRFGTWL